MITYIKDILPNALTWRYGLFVIDHKAVEGFESEDKTKLYIYTFGGVIVIHRLEKQNKVGDLVKTKRQYVPNNMAEVVFIIRHVLSFSFY